MKKITTVLKNKKNKRFLISSHQNLEGDAIGSMLALAELLEYLGKKVFLVGPERIPETYRFLPKINRIRYLNSSNKVIDYDVACIVDCTSLDRLGSISKAIYLTRPILNIDHHISNAHFGSVNWIAPKISCSGEQIYHLFKDMKVPINERAALYMYIAILTDTGSFRYSNTTAKTHEIIAELMQKRIDVTDIYRKIYERAQRSHITLLTDVLSTLDISRDGKIAWIKITKSMLKTHKAKLGTTQDFVNFPRSIDGVKIALAFREIANNTIKVSFRSNERVDVNKLAKKFRGGGHRSASGCTMKGAIEEVEKAVLNEAKKHLKESKNG
ncbi:MAG: bifunctional oligoribonuclease/PAP phosphatase NrnA [Candidatus Omnitrophica bacterium]|nr:bifunctional oligoribonuclease/PAP phosphatase NrnA [Candidatus Omnitrophota bacterium]